MMIKLVFTFLFLALTIPHSQCDDSNDSPPSPPVPSSSPSHSPAPSYSPYASPPGPRYANHAPETSAGPSPSANGPTNGFYHSPSPTPAPIMANLNHEADANFEAAKDTSHGRNKGGHIASITVGVIAGVCVVALGAMVYKKRQQNIRRAQYAYVARMELI